MNTWGLFSPSQGPGRECRFTSSLLVLGLLELFTHLPHCWACLRSSLCTYGGELKRRWESNPVILHPLQKAQVTELKILASLSGVNVCPKKIWNCLAANIGPSALPGILKLSTRGITYVPKLYITSKNKKSEFICKKFWNCQSEVKNSETVWRENAR